MKEQLCFFSRNNIKYIDYKDVETLSRFINPHSRMLSRDRNEITAKNQRKLSLAIKRARFMGLLPYVSR